MKYTLQVYNIENEHALLLREEEFEFEQRWQAAMTLKGCRDLLAPREHLAAGMSFQDPQTGTTKNVRLEWLGEQG